MATITAAAVKELRTKTGVGMMDCKRALTDAEGDVERAAELLRERGLAKAGKRADRVTSEGVVGIALGGTSAAMIELACETDFVARTDEFQALGQEIADQVGQDESLSDAQATLEAQLSDGTVGERLTAAISKMGENVNLKRVRRLAVNSGATGGYVHAGGKLGVIVALETDASGDAIEALAKDLAMHVAAADPTPLAVSREGVDAEIVEKERKVLTAQAIESGKPEAVVEKMVEGRLRKFFSENCLLEQAFVKDPDTTVGDLVKSVGKQVGKQVEVVDFVRFRLGEEAGA